MNSDLVIPAGGLVIGVGQMVFGVGSIRRGRRRRALVARCRPSRAVVTAVGERTMVLQGGANGVRLPIVSVRYLDARGVIHDSTLAISRSWERYAVGQEIDVLIDPEQPDTVLTRGNDTLFDLAGPFFMVFGGGFVALSLLVGYVIVRWF